MLKGVRTLRYSGVHRAYAIYHGWPDWAIARVSYQKQDGTPVVVHFVQRHEMKAYLDELLTKEDERIKYVEAEEIIWG